MGLLEHAFYGLLICFSFFQNSTFEEGVTAKFPKRKCILISLSNSFPSKLACFHLSKTPWSLAILLYPTLLDFLMTWTSAMGYSPLCFLSYSFFPSPFHIPHIYLVYLCCILFLLGARNLLFSYECTLLPKNTEYFKFQIKAKINISRTCIHIVLII